MSNLARRSTVLGLALVLFYTVGCGGGGAGGDNSSDPDVAVDLIVQQVLPTNGQEVLSDLSDVGGKITIRFSERLARGTVIDKNNAFNNLSSDLNILDSAFARVPGTPTILNDNTVGDRGNVLEFEPAGGVLPFGQFTVTVTRDVKNHKGGRLNQGKFDHRSSFTVGPDTFSPVVRNTFPAANQTEVAKNSQIIVTFNESLNPATVTTATVTVVDGGTAPPTPIQGTLKTSRDDFEIVFTPDPENPMPPNATIVVTVLGGANGVTDLVSNPFEGDPLTPGSFQFQFSTVTEPPDPANPLTHDIFTPNAPDATVYVTTSDSVLTLAEKQYILSGAADLTQWGNGNPIPFSKRKIGRPGEGVVDPRFGALDGHSWIYVVDSAGRDVIIMGSRDSKIVHRWKNLPDPRGLGIQFSGQTLYVTNFANDSVSALDIAIANVGSRAASDAIKELDKVGVPTPDGLGTTGGSRLDLTVGRGPFGAAHKPDGALLMIANQLDNTATLVNTATFTVNTEFGIGTNPQDAAVSFTFPGLGWFAWITCLGGGNDESGSVILYWNVPNGLQANITGFKNPKGIIYDYGISTWITNSGGDSCSRLTLAIAGGGFAATILPNITATIPVGGNPQDVTVDPFYTLLTLAPQAIITADRGSSQLTFIDATQPARPRYGLKIPGASGVFGYMDQ